MRTQSKQGFTIIEVVLVLAIAGLIFLMVFIALPALQKSQRDTQRRSDVGRFRAQINQYQANNKGGLPDNTDIDSFVTNYLEGNGGWIDPKTGEEYALKSAVGDLDKAGDYAYSKGSKCAGESFDDATGTRSYAVAMKLEGSGVTCQDNQ